MTTRWIRKSTRTALYARDEYTCQYCLCSVSPGVQVAPGIVIPAVPGTELATLDHRTPRSLGGGNDRSNLTTACVSCNAAKGERTEQDYRASLAPVPVPAPAPITVGVAIV
jgi:5-methylcytosine-specific restriction endonuclease McrA